jgi:hypothetical protein
MQIELYQILEFPAFFEKVKSQKISFKTSYKLAMLAKEVEVQCKFYTENFSNIVMTYSEKDENGSPIPTEDGQGVKLLPGVADECYDKINELRSLPIILPDTTFSIDEFVNLELSPMEVNAIIPFIKE